jgi:hypothetical protein
MKKTTAAQWLNEEKVGYWVGSFLSPKNQQKIAGFQAALQRELPGVIWTMPDVTQQHITLFEIVMTFRDYPEDRDEIFERHRAGIDAELRAQLANQGPIAVTLDTLEVSPAAIILRGTDDGSFQRIRNAVSGKHLLPNGTRTPPDIVHSSLARYVKEVDVEDVRSVLARYRLNLVQTVTEFEMVRIWRMPMDHTTVATYKLPLLSS